MQLLLYILLYPILLGISILPFPILYFFSDCTYILLYRIIGYRKKTVRDNLKLAFPNLSDKERLIIEKKSFHHLCDIFFEMVKTFTISRQEMEKRFKVLNLNDYLEIEKKGKSIALMIGHYASYEWAISMNHYLNFEGFGIYKKISNKYFDKLVKDIRSKFKATLITTKETKKIIEKNFNNKKMSIYGFASDQTPSFSEKTHWGTFMGIETPIHVGAEVLGKRFDFNFVYLKVKKVKRGFYETEIELLTDDVHSFPDYEISEQFIKKVEAQIYEAPEYYLWTHKRWKHRR